MELFHNQEYKQIDFTNQLFIIGEYIDCVFEQCNLQEQILENCIFENCTFKSCNLTSVNVKNTKLDQISFIDCKMIGILFYDCNDFIFSIFINQCILDYSSFYKMNLRNCKFQKSSLQSVDFELSDLQKLILDNCNLEQANFNQSNLIQTDFRTSINYQIRPESNSIKGAKFSQNGISGLLYHHQIIID